MKLIFVLVLALFSLHLSAQCDKICNEDPVKVMNMVEDNQAFEVYDEVFLFKNSGEYFAMDCKRASEKYTRVQNKFRHNYFCDKKCSIEFATKKIQKKNILAQIL